MAMLTLLSTHTDEVVVMAALTVRGLDDETKARLRVRAAQNGRSMEAEVRAILQASLSEEPTFGGLGTKEKLGYWTLDYPVDLHRCCSSTRWHPGFRSSSLLFH